MNAQPYHLPVMLAECLEWLALKPNGLYADLTFGGGGHSRAILEHLTEGGHLFAFDQDPDAQANDLKSAQFTLIRDNFRHLSTYFGASAQAVHQIQQGFPQKYVDTEPLLLDGILADLGVSSHQFDAAERGFSYRADAPLDMRMNPDSDQSTAADLLATLEPHELIRILREYGEVPTPHRYAHAIRAARPTTTHQLFQAVEPILPRKGGMSVLSQIFQALRIVVNDEMAVLEEMLESAVQTLKPGGRLVVMSYHSLEDRLVKHLFQTGNLEGRIETDLYGNRLTAWKPLHRKTITASETEIAHNPRARSARLRAAERIA